MFIISFNGVFLDFLTSLNSICLALNDKSGGRPIRDPFSTEPHSLIMKY